jgi:TolB protein
MKFVYLGILCILALIQHAIAFEKIVQTENQIEVRRDRGERDILVIAKVLSRTSKEGMISNKIRTQMQHLLKNKANIMPILQEDFQSINIATEIQNYNELKAKNIGYVLSGNISSFGQSFKLRVNVFDVYKGQKILSKDFIFTEEGQDQFTKQLTTQIYEFLTGEFGFFYGKLLYTVTEKPGIRPFKKVVLSSRVGEQISATAFTDGVDITFNPRYCKNDKEVFYVSQKPTRDSRIMIANRETSKISNLFVREFRDKEGISIFSPTISRDCNTVVFSASEKGSTNLYAINRSTDALTRLTGNKGFINTAPKFFDDDKKIIFVSDVTGKPKIWQMDANGENKKIITRGDGAYYSPSVSKDGKKIAFVKVLSGKFSLGIANIDGSGEELLHSGFLIESPSWTPIGKTIIFSMQKTNRDNSRLYTISLNGREPEELEALSGNLNEPLWVEEF